MTNQSRLWTTEEYHSHGHESRSDAGGARSRVESGTRLYSCLNYYAFFPQSERIYRMSCPPFRILHLRNYWTDVYV